MSEKVVVITGASAGIGAALAELIAQQHAGVIESRRPDVYTRPGASARVAGYCANVGVDP